MIVLTGALVQVFTLFQFRRLLGLERMHNEIERLSGHTIICGYGRIGVQPARALSEEAPVPDSNARPSGPRSPLARLPDPPWRSHQRGHPQTGRGHPCPRSASVLPDDATNVFITLSARSLNPDIQIIARGEAPSTESKLPPRRGRQGRPAHPHRRRTHHRTDPVSARPRRWRSRPMGEVKRQFVDFGLDLEVVACPAGSALVGSSVREAERRGKGAYFIVRIDRANGQEIRHPAKTCASEAGDGLLVLRGSRLSAGAQLRGLAHPHKLRR
jgi:trk system potassium uptake protein TrkA/voltage-gated potassium channel